MRTRVSCLGGFWNGTTDDEISIHTIYKHGVEGSGMAAFVTPIWKWYILVERQRPYFVYILYAHAPFSCRHVCACGKDVIFVKLPIERLCSECTGARDSRCTWLWNSFCFSFSVVVRALCMRVCVRVCVNVRFIAGEMQKLHIALPPQHVRSTAQAYLIVDCYAKLEMCHCGILYTSLSE